MVREGARLAARTGKEKLDYSQSVGGTALVTGARARGWGNQTPHRICLKKEEMVVTGEKKNRRRGKQGLCLFLTRVQRGHAADPCTQEWSLLPPHRVPSARLPPQPAEPPPQPSQRQTYQEPAQPSSGLSGKWLLGIAAVIGLLWLISFSNGNKSPTAPAHEASSQTKDSDRGAGPNKTTELSPPKIQRIFI